MRVLGSKRLDLQRFEVGNCSRRGISLLSLRKISVALLEKGKGPLEPLVSSGLRAACTPGGIRESFKLQRLSDERLNGSEVEKQRYISTF